jgi:hypothetical protein
MSLASIIAHPKTFLKQNALWPSGQLNQMALGQPDVVRRGTPQEGSRLWPIRLQRKSGVSCTRNGVPLPCWEIAPGQSLASTLAYYLPWRPNSTLSIVLGNKADFFITDAMNGCTFAYGAGGAPRVTHVNYNTFDDEGARKEGNPIDQPFMNREVRRVLGAAPQAALRKADYATSSFPNVTVIGVRRGNQWKFVYQKRDYIGSTTVAEYKWKSVHTIR